MCRGLVLQQPLIDQRVAIEGTKTRLHVLQELGGGILIEAAPVSSLPPLDVINEML
jgi:hypothetical protein